MKHMKKMGDWTTMNNKNDKPRAATVLQSIAVLILILSVIGAIGAYSAEERLAGFVLIVSGIITVSMFMGLATIITLLAKITENTKVYTIDEIETEKKTWINR